MFFLTLVSANNGDHKIVIFCKYVNLGFQLRFDHLNSVHMHIMICNLLVLSHVFVYV